MKFSTKMLEFYLKKLLICICYIFIFKSVHSQSIDKNNCPPIQIDQTKNAICFLDGQPFLCTDQHGLPAGTIVQIQCKHGFENQIRDLDIITCESDGRWSSSPTDCQPSCGTVIKNANSRIPWQAIIYNEQQQICSGTILSDKLIFTSAHCFQNNKTNGQFINSTQLKIGVGKLYSDYSAKELNTVQLLNVERLIVHPDYHGINGNGEFDVAIIKPMGTIEFSQYIRPICLHFRNRYSMEPNVPAPGSIGMFGIWSQIDQLKNIDVEILENSVCAAEQKALLSPDKCCVRAKNPEKPIGIENCGSAIGLPRFIDGNTKYFFGGTITSISNDNNFILVENPDFIINFILSEF